MSSTIATSTVAWSTIAARSLKAKVPEPIRMARYNEVKETLVSHLLYEDPDIKSNLLANKVFSVLQNALSPGSVLFSFPAKLFEHRSDAYRLVLEQIGPVVGDEFKPISQFGNRLKNELLFSVVFRVSEHTEMALSTGVTYEGVVYKGTPYNDGLKSKLVRVHMHLPMTEEEDDLKTSLLKSMAHYGKVCDIRKYKSRGFYEGQVSVLLDLTTVQGTEYQPLSKMIYLESWDVLVPASYRGAPPVCYHCRQAGHIKKDCPRLKSIECFKCHHKGHTARFCKTEDKSFSDDMEEYVALTEELKRKETAEKSGSTEVEETQATTEQVVTEVKTVEVENPLVKSQEKKVDDLSVGPIDEDMSDTDEVILVKPANMELCEEDEDAGPSYPVGSSASKYAGCDVKTTMTVDTPQEMLGMSTLKKETQRRRLSVKQSTKVPAISGGKPPLSRIINTRKGT